MRSSGAILVVGPKFCGKTTTCSQYARSIYRINTKNVIKTTRLNPSIALVGERPHLIDEWQKVPDIWNYVKEDLDIEYEFGRYILTGSYTPVDKTEIQHDGSGRITPLRMRTMSLFESLESSGKISLKELLENENIETVDPNPGFKIDDLAFLICRGGWPLFRTVSNHSLKVGAIVCFCGERTVVILSDDSYIAIFRISDAVPKLSLDAFFTLIIRTISRVDYRFQLNPPLFV